MSSTQAMTLTIRFTGVCVFFPGPGNSRNSRVVLVDGRTMTPSHKPLLTLTDGTCTSHPASTFPVELDNQHLRVRDAKGDVNDQDGGAASHHDGLLGYMRLRRLPNFPPNANANVNGDADIHVACVGRIALHGGDFSTKDPTVEEWCFIPTKGPVVKVLTFDTTVEWRRTIDGGSVTIRTRKKGAKDDSGAVDYVFKPKQAGGNVLLELSNSEPVGLPTDPDFRPEFGLVYKVFQDNNLPKYELRRLVTSPAPAGAPAPNPNPRKSPQYPCVGGCSC